MASLSYLNCVNKKEIYAPLSLEELCERLDKMYDKIESGPTSPWCNICDRPLEYCRCEK